MKLLSKSPLLRHILLTIFVLAMMAAAFCLGSAKERIGQAKVDTDYVKTLITRSSDLTAAKYTFTGITEYQDAGIPVLNQSDFIMVYKATARAGIDVEQVKVKVDDNSRTVFLTIPKATVQDVNVDTSSISYFDEGFAIANLDQKQDSNKAIDMAKKDAMEEVSTSGVLEMADTQSEALIKGILQPAIPSDYTFEITKQ